jgi:Ca2+-binding EF-hand superfamily protein
MGCGASKAKAYEAPAADAAPEVKPVVEAKPDAVPAEAAAPDAATEAQLKDKADDSKEDQLAKCMGNLEYIRRELLTPISAERKAKLEAEMKGRKQTCKTLRAEGVIPSAGVCVFNQIDLMKTRKVDKKGLERLVKSLATAYKGKDFESVDDIMATLDADKSGDIDITEWCTRIAMCPKFYAVLQEDLDPDWGKLRSYRNLEDQLAKLLGNIQRLCRELLSNSSEREQLGFPALTPERKAEVDKELGQRKDQAKKLIEKGVRPSPGYVVFAQVDAEKKRKLTRKELERLVKAIGYVFKGRQIEDVDKIMTVMDADKSGDIDESEWVQNLQKLPLLYRVLQEDIEIDTGTLISFRTPEDQLAKCMGNIERLRREKIANQAEREILKLPVLTDERKAEIDKEIRQRKDQCKRYRAMGIVPSPGYVVFNQVDSSKNRKLDIGEIKRLIKAIQYVFAGKEIESADEIMAVMDADRSGDIDEFEWTKNLKKLPKLYQVLSDDIDPDWGTLKSFRTPEDQLAKCMGNLERLRRELQTDVTEERKAKILKDIRQRKDQCKAYRAQGISPSPGYVVFNQIDVGKARQLEKRELERLLKGISAVYKDKDIESVDKIMSVMDADRSGSIDESEWVNNLKKLPMLYKVLSEDVDPDWGTLKSYRTLEDQLAKLFGNIFRLEEKVAGLEGEEAEKCSAEIEERKAQAVKMRAQGVIPSPGIVIFSQLDKNKSRTLEKDELSAALVKIAPDADMNAWFAKIDPDGTGSVGEAQWLLNVKHIPELVAAIMADTDPDTGRMKSL